MAGKFLTGYFDTDSSIVREGVWHLEGAVTKFDGVRLTLRNRDARIVLAALVILVGITANRSWRIVSFVIHRIISSASEESSSKTRKRQVVLRNSETAGGTFLALFGISRPGKPKLSSFGGSLVLAAALLHFVGFIGLGLWTSVIDRGNLVVSKTSAACGHYLPNKFGSDDSDFIRQWVVNNTLDAESYAQDCYGDGKGQMGRTCGRMYQASIPYKTEMDACPFSDVACAETGDGSAFAMDSGNITFAQLGFNTRNADKLSFRRREICAPIKSEPFLYEEEDLNELIIELRAENSHSGFVFEESTERIRAFAHNLQSLEPKRNESIVFQKNTFSRYYSTHVTRAERGEYALPALKPERDSMSVTIISVEVGSEITFPNEVLDPLFNATRKIEYNRNGKDYKRYQRQKDQGFKSVACQEVTQFCSKITGKCTPWGGISQLVGERSASLAEFLFGGADGSTRADRKATELVGALLQSHLGEALKYRGGAGLQLSRFLVNGDQLELPNSNEPWKVELMHMFEVLLSRIQRGVLQAVKVTGFEGQSSEQTKSDLASAGYKTVDGFCNHILFHSEQHRSLSMDGIRLLLTFSIFIILASFFDYYMAFLVRLPSTPKFIRKRFSASLEQWKLDSCLSLIEESESTHKRSPSSAGLRKLKIHDFNKSGYTEINEEENLGLISEQRQKKSYKPQWITHASASMSASRSSKKNRIPRKPVSSFSSNTETQYMRVEAGQALLDDSNRP